MEIILKLVQRLSLSFWCIIHQDISVFINAFCLIPQKDIIAVASAQQIHFLIHNQIFIMHAIIHLKQIDRCHRIVNSHFHILI